MRSWQRELKEYEAYRNRQVVCEPPVRPVSQAKQLQNPITHEFYDKKAQEMVEAQSRRYQLMQQNIARDRQLKNSGSFNFVDDRDAYQSIRPQKRNQVYNYEFQQPHVAGRDFAPQTRNTRVIPQNSSDGVRSTFTNYADPNLPLISKKSNHPYTNRKRIFAESYDAVAKFPLGYIGIE